MAEFIEWGKPKLVPEKPCAPLIPESICVDASWSPKTKVVEFQGVDTKTGRLLFQKGPYAGGTGNVGEFLAIVYGLLYLDRKKLDIPLYSDSKTAICWVNNMRINTCLQPTEENGELMEALRRAKAWLKGKRPKTRILKWNTREWGEIPADFGRK
jgi:ribonuclease HI